MSSPPSIPMSGVPVSSSPLSSPASTSQRDSLDSPIPLGQRTPESSQESPQLRLSPSPLSSGWSPVTQDATTPQRFRRNPLASLFRPTTILLLGWSHNQTLIYYDEYDADTAARVADEVDDMFSEYGLFLSEPRRSIIPPHDDLILAMRSLRRVRSHEALYTQLFSYLIPEFDAWYDEAYHAPDSETRQAENDRFPKMNMTVITGAFRREDEPVEIALRSFASPITSTISHHGRMWVDEMPR